MFKLNFKKGITILFSSLLFTLLSTSVAFAATVYWDGNDSGCTDNLWTNSNCWDGGSVPGASDDVVIQVGSGDVNIESSITVNSITVDLGYIRTIELGGSTTLFIDTDMYLNGALLSVTNSSQINGNVILTDYADIDLYENLTVNGYLSLNGSSSIDGNTTSTLYIGDGIGTDYLEVDSVRGVGSIHDVNGIIVTGYLSAEGSNSYATFLDVSDQVILDDAGLYLSASTDIGSSFTLSNNSDFSTDTTATIDGNLYATDSDLAFGNSTAEINGILSATNSDFIAGTGDIEFYNNVYVSGGTFTASTGTTLLSETSILDLEPTNFNHSSGLFSLQPNSNLSINGLGAAVEFYDFEIDGGSTVTTDLDTYDLDIAANFWLRSGYLETSTGSVSVGGMTTFEENTSLTATAAADLDFSNLTMASGTTITPASSTFDITGTLTMNGSTIAAGTGAASIGELVLNDGTYNATSSTLDILTGVTMGGGTFNGGSSTIDIDGHFDVDDVSTNHPVVNMSSGTTYVGGSFTLQNDPDVAFAHSNGTVVLDAPLSRTLQTNNFQAFYNLEISPTASDVVYVANGNDVHVDRNLTITNGEFYKKVGDLYVENNFILDGGDFTSSSNQVNVDNELQIIDNSSTYNHSDTQLDVYHGLIVSAGTAYLPISTTVESLTQTGGVIHAQDSNFSILSGSIASSITDGEFYTDSGTVSTNTDLSINGSSLFQATSPTLNIGGTLAVAGTSSVTMNNADLNISTDLTVADTAIFHSGLNEVDVDNDVNITSSGTFTATSDFFKIGGNLELGASADFDENSGWLEFDSSVASDTVAIDDSRSSGAYSFANLQINLTGAGAQYNVIDDTTLSGDLILLDGEINDLNAAPLDSIYTNGDLIIGEDFDGGDSAAVMDGNDTTYGKVFGGAVAPGIILDNPNSTFSLYGLSTGTHTVTYEGDVVVTDGTFNAYLEEKGNAAGLPSHITAPTVYPTQIDQVFNGDFEIGTDGIFNADHSDGADPVGGDLDFNANFTQNGGTVTSSSLPHTFEVQLGHLRSGDFLTGGGDIIFTTLDFNSEDIANPNDAVLNITGANSLSILGNFNLGYTDTVGSSHSTGTLRLPEVVTVGGDFAFNGNDTLMDNLTWTDTIRMTGSSVITENRVDPTTNTIELLEINTTVPTYNVTVSGDLDIDGIDNLTLLSGELTAGSIQIDGDLFVGENSLNNTTDIILNSSSEQLCRLESGGGANLTLNNTQARCYRVGYDGGAETFTFTNNTTVTAGTLDLYMPPNDTDYLDGRSMPSNVHTVGTIANINGGTLNADHESEASSVGGNVTFSGDLNLNSGTLNSTGAGFKFDVAGKSTLKSGTFTAGNGSLIFRDTFSLNPASGDDSEFYGANAASLALYLKTDIGSGGDGGVFELPATNTYFGADLDFNGNPVTFAHNGGTVTFDGTSNSTITVPSGGTLTLNSLVVDKDADNDLISTNGTVLMEGDLSLTTGLLNSGTFEFQGDLLDWADTFAGATTQNALLVFANANPVTIPKGVTNFPDMAIRDATVYTEADPVAELSKTFQQLELYATGTPVFDNTGNWNITFSDDVIIRAGSMYLGEYRAVPLEASNTFNDYVRIYGGTLYTESSDNTFNHALYILGGTFDGTNATNVLSTYLSYYAISVEDSGTFTAPPELEVYAGMQLESGITFNHNNGHITFSGGDYYGRLGYTNSGNSIDLYDLTIDKTGGERMDIFGTKANVLNNLHLKSGYTLGNANRIYPNPTVELIANDTITWDEAYSYNPYAANTNDDMIFLRIKTTTDVTIPEHADNAGAIIIDNTNNPSLTVSTGVDADPMEIVSLIIAEDANTSDAFTPTFDNTSGRDIDFIEDLVIYSGYFKDGDANVIKFDTTDSTNVGTEFRMEGGTFNAGSGEFNLLNIQTSSSGNSSQFFINDGEFNLETSTLTAFTKGDLEINGGHFDASTANIYYHGFYPAGGGFDVNAGTVDLPGAGYDLIMDGRTSGVQQTAGSTINHNNGTFTLNALDGQDVHMFMLDPFYNLVITCSPIDDAYQSAIFQGDECASLSGTVNDISGSAVDTKIEGDLIVKKTSMDLIVSNSKDLYISGDIVECPSSHSACEVGDSGTIDITATGDINLIGTNQAIYGSPTFEDLHKIADASESLTFEAGKTTTITGDAELKGTDPALLSLVSTNPGSEWYFDPQGTRDFNFLEPTDSNNVNAEEIITSGYNIYDGGNNTNWLFSPTQDTPVLTSTSGNDLSTDDLTVTAQNVSDPYGNPIRIYYNWIKNGSPLAQVNMAFEANNGEEQTTTVDYSGNTYTVALNGGVLWGDAYGQEGRGAYYYDGVDDHIEYTSGSSIASAYNNAENATVSFWFRPEDLASVSSGTKQTLISTYESGNFEVFLSAPGDCMAEASLCFAVNVGGTRYEVAESFTNLTLANGSWYHVGATYDGTEANLYVNDSLVAQDSSMLGDLNMTATPLCLAEDANSTNCSGSNFNGYIDDLMISPTALSAQQLSNIYQDDGNVLDATMTVSNDVVSAEVILNNGGMNGSTRESNSITIDEVAITGVLIDSPSGVFQENENVDVSYTLLNGATKGFTRWLINSTNIAEVYMTFEEGVSSQLKDFSGDGRDGSIVGTVNYTENLGRNESGAYYFSGSDDYIFVSEVGLPYGASERTVCAWIKPDHVNSSQLEMAVSYGNNSAGEAFGIGQRYDNLVISTYGTLIEEVDYLTAGEEYFVCATYDGSVASLYANGSLLTQSAVAINTVEQDAFIGDMAGDTNNGWTGYIDDVYIFNKAFTDAAISTLYLEGDLTLPYGITAEGDTVQACTTPYDTGGLGSEECSPTDTITEAVYPRAENVVITSTGGAPDISPDDLTLSYDLVHGATKGIVNWVKDSSSLALLNLAFEANGGVENATASDYSGNGNDATVNSNVVWDATGDRNGTHGAYHFGGSTGDNLTIPHSTELKSTEEFTVEAWINMDVADTADVIAMNGAAFDANYLLRSISGVVDFGFDGSSGWCSATSTSTLSSGTWYHVAGVYDGENIQVFINGTLEDSTNCGTNIPESDTNDLYIGSYSTEDGAFDGYIDEFKYYQIALTEDQLANHAAGNENIIDSSMTLSKEQWKAEVYGNDGSDIGLVELSNTVTIADVSITSTDIVSTSGHFKQGDDVSVLYLLANGAEAAITKWLVNSANFADFYMPFEFDDGSAPKDYSGETRTVTVNGDAHYVEGKGQNSSGAYYFDGGGDYIDITTSNLPYGASDLTMCAWINPDHTNSSQYEFAVSYGSPNTNQAISIGQRYDDIYLSQYGGDLIVTNFLTAGEGHFICGVNDGVNLSMYSDGVFIDSTPSLLNIVESDFRIGQAVNTAGQYWTGYVDDVYIFDSAFNATQIQDLYNNGDTKINKLALSGGDTVQACGTPYDQGGEGAELCSTTETISINIVPTHDNPILTSTSGNGESTDDLTVTAQNVVDPDSDEVKTIYNWILDGTSITAFNLPFEGNQGNEALEAYDYSGNSRHGTVSQAIWTNDSGHETPTGSGAYTFDGVDDYIELDNVHLDILTISAWFKTEDKTKSQRIISKTQNGEYAIALNDSGASDSLAFILNEGGTDYFATYPTASLTNDTWYHVAATYDGETMVLYVDGVAVDTESGPSGAIQSNTSPICIGAEASALACDGGSVFQGAIDEVVVSTVAFSPEQITNISNNNENILDSNETNLVDQWSAEVTINDGYQNSITKESNTITIEANPPTVTNLGPADYVDGSSNTERQPTLTFDVDDPEGLNVFYRILIDNDSDFSSPVVDFTSDTVADPDGAQMSFTVGQAGANYTVGAPGQTLADDEYYWEVIVESSLGLNSGFTTVNQGAVDFVVDNIGPTEQIVQIAPIGGELVYSSKPTYRWTEISDDAGGYIIEVVPNDAVDFADPRMESFTAPANASTASTSGPTLSPGTYKWRIYAVDGAGNFDISGSNPTVETFVVANMVPEFSTYMYLAMFILGFGFIYYKRRENTFEI